MLKAYDAASVPLVAHAALRQGADMSGHAAAIFRHPVKGFTPEALQNVQLAPGEGFPFDRLWAVENGHCGFDPAAPAFVSKSKFTVLAQIARVAAARTRYDETSIFMVGLPSLPRRTPQFGTSPCGAFFFRQPPWR